MSAVRVWTSSAGLDPRALAAGQDVVLDLDPRHGAELENGVYVLDALDPADRFAVDRLALASMNEWRSRMDGPLTLDGICWAWVWELELYEIINPLAAAAVALRSTLAGTRADAVELMDTDPGTQQLARAVAEHLGLSTRSSPEAAEAASLRPRRRSAPKMPLVRRVRRRAASLVTCLGVPTLMRRGSVLFRSYWQLMDVLDRMLEDPRARPAISIQKRPAGVRRQLRTALRGGWLGAPTPLDRGRGRRLVPKALAALDADPGFQVEGMELGPVLAPRLRALVERRLAGDAAHAAVLRRGLRPGRPARIIGPCDTEPPERLVVAVGREAGIPTLLVSHGAYMLHHELPDLEYSDEVVLWSREVAPRMTWDNRCINVVGYPLAHAPRPPRRLSSIGRLRVAVLGQLWVETTSTIDKRVTARSYNTAVEAVLARFPDATVVLRPHPAAAESRLRGLPNMAEHQRDIHDLLLRRFAGADLRIDGQTPIGELLADVDLLIGGSSTATLQAALVGTPTIVLNMTGVTWPWPLGGDTSVPVARSREELEAALERFQTEGIVPGAADLLAALGANGTDTVGEIAEIALGRGRREPASGDLSVGAAKEAVRHLLTEERSL
jgi:hypothetical protein